MQSHVALHCSTRPWDDQIEDPYITGSGHALKGPEGQKVLTLRATWHARLPEDPWRWMDASTFGASSEYEALGGSKVVEYLLSELSRQVAEKMRPKVG